MKKLNDLFYSFLQVAAGVPDGAVRNGKMLIQLTGNSQKSIR